MGSSHHNQPPLFEQSTDEHVPPLAVAPAHNLQFLTTPLLIGAPMERVWNRSDCAYFDENRSVTITAHNRVAGQFNGNGEVLLMPRHPRSSHFKVAALEYTPQDEREGTVHGKSLYLEARHNGGVQMRIEHIGESSGDARNAMYKPSGEYRPLFDMGKTALDGDSLPQVASGMYLRVLQHIREIHGRRQKPSNESVIELSMVEEIVRLACTGHSYAETWREISLDKSGAEFIKIVRRYEDDKGQDDESVKRHESLTMYEDGISRKLDIFSDGSTRYAVEHGLRPAEARIESYDRPAKTAPQATPQQIARFARVLVDVEV